MEIIDKEVTKFLKILNSEEKKWNTETLKKIAHAIIFFKYFENGVQHTHYLNSLIQDALTIIDSLSKRSERYYNFILRSYIENFMRVLIALEDDNSMGVMKLFKYTKQLLEKNPDASIIFDQIENQYNECCLYVHSNIKAKTEISVYLKMIIERNDFQENSIVNSSLKKFETILSVSIKLLLLCRTETVDNSFYRNKGILKKIITQEDYSMFLLALKS